MKNRIQQVPIPSPRRLARAALALAIIGALLLLPVFASAAFKDAADYRAHLPYVSYVTWTGSMFPTLKGGEDITVLPVAYASLRSCQIVVVWPHNSDHAICHRTKYYTRDARGAGWVTQGDNCWNEDPELMTDQTFVGVVVISGLPKPRPAGAKPPSSLGLKRRGDLVNAR